MALERWKTIANTFRNRGARLFRATEFRHSRSQRSGSTGHGSQRMAIYGCDYAAKIAMCSFLYRNTFSWRLTFGRGSSAIDPKLEKRNGPS